MLNKWYEEYQILKMFNLIQWERNDAIPGKFPKLTWYQPVHKSIFWLSISIIKNDLKIKESKKKKGDKYGSIETCIQ